MLISIIVPFYDNDYDKISNIINELNKLTFNKEVIFDNDRNDKTEKKKKKYNIPNEYKIVPSYPTGEKVSKFEARRNGVLNATGDYI